MTMTTSSAPTARPWWREPMLWLVFGLPLASIVAGVGLVIVAVRAGGADSVTDQVQRVAQIQTTDMGPDQRAQAMNLSAIVRLESGRIDVVPVTGNLGTGALRLTLAHPAQAAEDRLVGGRRPRCRPRLERAGRRRCWPMAPAWALAEEHPGGPPCAIAGA